MPSRDWFRRKAEEHSSIIKDYIAKYPYLSSSKLATIILKENKIKNVPRVFRQIITTYKEINRKTEGIELEDDFDLDIPDSFYTERERFVIPKSVDRLLVLCDIHFPYHSREALLTAIKYGSDNGMNGILFNGDLLDCYQESKFSKDPTKLHLMHEIEIAKRFFEQMRKKFPNMKIYYKFGNHEARHKRYLMDKAQELFDAEEVQLESLLKLRSFGIEMIDDLSVIEYGRLNIIHGHEIYSARGSVNLARNLRLKANDNVLFGHFHQSQEEITKTIKDKIIGSFAVGSLCGLKPDYFPINQWVHGFAFVEREDNGYYKVKNKKIIHGRIL